MANVLYAPTVEPYTIAQTEGEQNLIVYFKKSNYNTMEEWQAEREEGKYYVHAAVFYQQSGLSAVNRSINSEAENRLTATGYILDLLASYDIDKQMYKVAIPGTLIKKYDSSGNGEVQGWEAGVIYKIQLRLSKKGYIATKEKNDSQALWCSKNQKNFFSEWSTVTVTKITSQVNLLVADLKYDSRENNSEKNIHLYTSNVLELNCNYLNDDITETLYSYRVVLKEPKIDNQKAEQIIEDSKEILINKYQYTSNFKYKIKHELEDDTYYNIEITIKTINKYEKTFLIRIKAAPVFRKEVDLRIKYAENDQDGSLFTEPWYNEIINYKDKVETYLDLQNYDKSLLSEGDFIKVMIDINHKNSTTYYILHNNDFSFVNTNAQHIGKIITSKDMEEEEGVFCLKIFDPAEAPSMWEGILILRRTDEDSNFEIWEDLQYFKLEQTLINYLPNFYDFTLESGKCYRYCLQYEDKFGNRTGNLSSSITAPIKRKFEYTYLLGQNNEYLPIKFNTNLSNYQLVRQDTLSPTLGSRYPYFTRAAAPKYKQFEMSGTISFHMDECEFFLKSGDIYGYSYYETGDRRTNIPIIDGETGLQETDINYRGHIVEQYEEIEFMDYYLEKKFREKVIEFLTNGKPKLFRSSSEPNMIVMVTNASFTPNQALGRLIYDFSCTCTEIDEVSLSNYLLYKFIEYNDIKITRLFYDSACIGQITGVCASGHNLMEDIKNKIDGRGKDDGSGYENIITKITDLDIQIHSKPSIALDARVGSFYGWKLNIGGDKDIIIDYRTHRYILDPLIELSTEQDNWTSIKIFDAAPPKEGPDYPIEYEINFIYYVHKEPFSTYNVTTIVEEPELGQVYGVFGIDESIYRKIYMYFFKEYSDKRVRLKNLISVRIEGEPGATFEIIDKSSGIENKNLHEIPPTGYLNIDDNLVNNITGITYKGIRIKNMQGEYEYIHRDTTALIDYIGMVSDETIERKTNQ